MAKKQGNYGELYDVLCQLEGESRSFSLASLAEIAGYKESSLRVYVRNKLRNVYLFPGGNGLFTVRGVSRQSRAEFTDYMCQKSTRVSVNPQVSEDALDFRPMQEDPFSQRILDRIFSNGNSDKQELSLGENDWLEFKSNYNHGNRVDYGKTMAAYANAHGGYIVFGVQDQGRCASGMANDNFTHRFDSNKVTQYLEKMFSPTIRWMHYIYQPDDRVFGIIYTYESTFKPIVAIKNEGEIKDCTIYYRYSGESKPIRSSDLLRIVEERVSSQDAGWREMIQKMAALTPQNADVLDLATGRIGSTPILIDMNVLEQIKFIKEGQFREVEGGPALKLIGEVRGLAGAVVIPKEIPVSNLGMMKAGAVADKVKAAIRRPFNASTHHAKCWKYYSVRPSRSDSHPENCKTEYCCYDKAHGDYLYTKEWVDFLIEELSDDSTYARAVKGESDTTKV